MKKHLAAGAVALMVAGAAIGAAAGVAIPGKLLGLDSARAVAVHAPAPTRDVVGTSGSGASSARPLQTCSRSTMKQEGLSGSLAATSWTPSCGGAALMAGDLYYDASSRFPRLPEVYMAHAHGTNTAGDPRAVYHCKLSNRFKVGRHGDEWRRTTALCTNRWGGFRYVFDMA
jgi:hypothetical protein